jgi:hypothetical protein
MRVAVARQDFEVSLRSSDSGYRIYSVANGEDLKLVSGMVSGAYLDIGFYPQTIYIMGYLVEIEGQHVFVHEKLIEVFLKEGT